MHGLIFLLRDTISFRVEVVHSHRTSAEVESGKVEWVKPAFLKYESNSPFSKSISITNVNSGANSVVFEVRFHRLCLLLSFLFIFSSLKQIFSPPVKDPSNLIGLVYKQI